MDNVLSDNLIDDICRRIKPVDMAMADEFAKAIDVYLPPSGDMGALRDMAMRYVSVAGLKEEIKPPATIIFCADHGVAAENVSAYPPETTLHMTANYVLSKGAAANAFSNFTGSRFMVVDMGIKGDTGNLPGLIDCKVAEGTQNSAQGPAMTREQAIRSLYTGYLLGFKMANEGHTIMLPGEMGISNTTASAAITAALCGLDPAETTGRGTNISDERLVRKVATVRRILEVNKPNPNDPIDVLAKVGGFELGGIAGLILGAAAWGAVTILDGFNTGASALIAAALCPRVKDYLIASHIGGETGHKHVLERLELQPVMTLDLKLGEAIGSSLAADLLIKTLLACVSLSKTDAEQDKLIDRIRGTAIDAASVVLTDKTFNFYTNTMPPLDKLAMEKCQDRLDNLAKPIYCLGTMENILCQLCGIIGDELPGTDISKGLLLFGLDKFDHHTAVKEQLCDEDGVLTSFGESLEEGFPSCTLPQMIAMESFAMPADVEVTIGHLMLGHTQMDAFEYGRQQGEYCSLHNSILGLGLIDSNPAIIGELADLLVDERGRLRRELQSFLEGLDSSQQMMISVILGAMVAAAHNRSLVVLDDAATVAVAKYAVQLLPDLQDFLLPVEPNLYQMNIKTPGLTALAGISLVQASLHVLNDMRTFAEAQVAVANDGPGKGKQFN